MKAIIRNTVIIPHGVIRLISLVSLLIVQVSAYGQKLVPSSDPANVGVSEDQLSLIDEFITEYIDNEIVPGGTFLIARRGEIVYNKSFGHTNLNKTRAYANDDIYRLASMTKAVTSVAIMQLVEKGKLRLNDPIKYYLPAFAEPVVLQYLNADSSFTTIPSNGDITIRHLLSHTSGIGYGDFDPERLGVVYSQFGVMNVGLSHKEMTTKELVDKIAKVPLSFHPGEKYLYGLNMDVLGRIVEVVSGMELDEYFKKNIFDPLGMKDTWFYLPESHHDRLVDIYTLDDQRKWIMAPEESSAMIEYPLRADNNHYAGGGGLSGSTMDYARFIQALMNNGAYNGHRILSRKSIETIATDQLALLGVDHSNYSQVPGMTMGLGFGVTMDAAEGHNLTSVGSYYWGGMFNTKYFIDPQEELIFVGMTQIVPFIRPDFWDRLTNIIYSSLTD